MKTRLTSSLPRATMTMLVLMFTSINAWTINLNGNDSWDETTSTLTVNSNPSNDQYENCNEIMHVIISNSVTSIGEDAFYNCTGLTTVTFEANSQLTDIGAMAFAECNNTGFTSIEIPASVTHIDNSAFFNCDKLATVTFGDNSQLATIGIQTFNGTAISSIIIPAGVTTIGNYAFGGCEHLTSINVEAGNTAFVSDGGVLFNIDKTTLIQYPIGNTALSYAIPYGVTTIGNNAFDGCGSLRSVNIPASVTSIENYSFFGTGLTSVTIPASVTSIGREAFEECYDLSLVYELRSTPPTLGNNAFSFCANNLVIYIPNGTDFDYQGSNNWNSYTLQELTANGNCGTTGHESEVFWFLVNNTLTISGTGAMADHFTTYWPWHSYRGSITSVVISKGVSHIGEYAFKNCSITSIDIPASVTSIGGSAFNSCTLLTTVNFAANSQLETIGDHAFHECNNIGLTSIAIPVSVTSIGEQAFRSCTGLTSFTIPFNVAAIGDHAFFECSNLASITVDANNAYYASQEGVLLNKDKTTLIQYPIGKTASTYIIPTTVTSIVDQAFDGCTDLSSIIIPASVQSIGEFVFSGCSNLSSVTIYAPSLTDYGAYAFYNNKDGRKIYVFSDCENMYELYWPDYASDIYPIPDLTVRAADDSDPTKGKWTSYYNSLADVTVAYGTTIYKATYDNVNNLVSLTQISGDIIKKGEAVILKSNDNIELSSAANSGTGDYDDNDLHGVDYATPLADLGTVTDTYYVLGNKNGHFGFHKYTGTNMPANKAYLRISGDGDALAPTLDINLIDSETTGISEIAKSQEPKANGQYFDLQGRKVANPTKGLYIVNGKKLIVK